MKLLYVAAAFLLACFALSALANGQKSGQLIEKERPGGTRPFSPSG